MRTTSCYEISKRRPIFASPSLARDVGCGVIELGFPRFRRHILVPLFCWLDCCGFRRVLSCPLWVGIFSSPLFLGFIFSPFTDVGVGYEEPHLRLMFSPSNRTFPGFPVFPNICGSSKWAIVMLSPWKAGNQSTAGSGNVVTSHVGSVS